ncbi:MAG: hypothetical protein ACRCVV_21280 [Shewanella sp.]
MKLSPAQKSLVDEIEKYGEVRCSVTYNPAQKLISLGLVDAKEDRYGTVTMKKKVG